MESAARPAEGRGVAPGDKGLKADAIGYLSNLVIGVASTAPGVQPRGDPRASSSRSTAWASTPRP